MGFLDKLVKAAKVIDSVAGEGSQLSKLADEAKRTYDAAMGNTPARQPQAGTANTGSAATVRRMTPDIVMNSGAAPIAPYKVAQGNIWGADINPSPRMTYEIPEDFGAFDSCAEPEMCYLYKAEGDEVDGDVSVVNLNKPYIYISPCRSDEVKEFQSTGTVRDTVLCEPVSVGKMLFRTKMIRGENVFYFYGFVQKYSNFKMAIELCYKKDVMGTPVENKLMQILDHAAATYWEE